MRYSTLITIVAAAAAATALPAAAEVTSRDMEAPIGRSGDTAIEPGGVLVDGLSAVQSEDRDARMDTLGSREDSVDVNEWGAEEPVTGTSD